MSEETTPLLGAATRSNENEQGPEPDDGQPEEVWNASSRVLWLLPVVIVMTFSHAFHDITLMFISRPLVGNLTFRSAAVATGFLSSLFSTPFWSALGDRYGRKPVILVSLGSAVVPNLGLLLVHVFGLHEAFYLCAILLGGFLGGYTTFRGVMYASIADTIPANHRLGIFSVFQGFIWLSYFTVDYVLFHSTRENVAVLSWPLLFALGLAILFAHFYLQESFSRPEEPAEREASSGVRIWFPGNFLVRSSLVGLALCLYSFIPAMEEYHFLRHFWWDLHDKLPNQGSQWLFWQDAILKSIRFFAVVPALAFYYRLHRFPNISPLQWDLSLIVLSPLLIGAIGLISAALAVIGAELLRPTCGPETLICNGLIFAFMILWLGMTILPNLCNVGGLPALYSFAAGYSQLGNQPREWGLFFGRLSILQSLAEGVTSELDSLLKLPVDRWLDSPVFAVVAYATYLMTLLATAGLVWLSTRLTSSNSN